MTQSPRGHPRGLGVHHPDYDYIYVIFAMSAMSHTRKIFITSMMACEHMDQFLQDDKSQVSLWPNLER